MNYLRIGECNQCGECCGYPRKTDYGQNNAWPTDWPDGISNWQQEDKEKAFPILKLIGHDYCGTLVVGGHHMRWIMVKDHGLCKHNMDEQGFTSWDQRCPFLGAKQDNGQVPCLLYGTPLHFIWNDHCNRTPPPRMSQEEVEDWKKNCPSCSFEWKPEE